MIFWSFTVGGALVNATGVGANTLFPIHSNSNYSIVLWGIIHSILGICIVKIGGIKIFEKIMSLLVLIMFFTVLFTAFTSTNSLTNLINFSSIETSFEDSSKWILALMGGVGGTLTILSYGYWISESGRRGQKGLKESRIDLSLSYFFTGIFSVAMIVIGSNVDIDVITKQKFCRSLVSSADSKTFLFRRFIQNRILSFFKFNWCLAKAFHTFCRLHFNKLR